MKNRTFGFRGSDDITNVCNIQDMNPFQENNKKNAIKSQMKFGLSFCLVIVLFALNGCRPHDEGNSAATNPLVEKGNNAINEKNWNSAIESFSEALSASPDNTDLLYRRAVAYLAQAKDHYNLAEAAITREDIPVAEEEAKKADELFEKAKNDCQTALNIDSKSLDIHYILGCIYIYQGNWNNAIDEFSQCIKVDSQNPLPYQRRGEVYGYTGDNMNEAIDLKRAAELGYSE